MTAPEQTHESARRMIRGAFDDINCHPYWDRAAADAVMALPGVRDGQAATTRLGVELARHYAKRWAPESDTTVCAAGCGSFPCESWINLTGGAQ